MDNYKNTIADAAQTRGAFLFREEILVANLIVKGGDYNCKCTNG